MKPSTEERPENPNELPDPHAGGDPPPQGSSSGCAVLLGALVAASCILIGLYLSLMMFIAAGLSATGVSTAGGFLMLLAPVPALVGLVLGVLGYRAGVRAR